jgi:phage replication-related protein YjqB (UPF0714/DUF867 family)
MPDICKTVVVMTPNGPVRMNESKYDPSVHTLAGEAAPQPVREITRGGIDKMKKAEVAELLDAHGAETDGKLAEMRDRLKAVMFVGL